MTSRADDDEVEVTWWGTLSRTEWEDAGRVVTPVLHIWNLDDPEQTLCGRIGRAFRSRTRARAMDEILDEMCPQCRDVFFGGEVELVEPDVVVSAEDEVRLKRAFDARARTLREGSAAERAAMLAFIERHPEITQDEFDAYRDETDPSAPMGRRATRSPWPVARARPSPASPLAQRHPSGGITRLDPGGIERRPELKRVLESQSRGVHAWAR